MANVAALIRAYARRYGIDPAAALAVASVEGGLHTGGVGDRGTSYGPFQLHVGGELPRGKGAGWANSPQGIAYALSRMAASGARGKSGRAAVESIVRNFERPADPGSEISRALALYGSGGGGGGAARPASAYSDRGAPAVSGASQGQAFAQALLNPRVSHNPMRLLSAIRAVQAPQAPPASAAAPGVGGPAGPAWSAPSGGGITYSGQRFTHPTEGLAGYPAVDLFAKPGTPFLAPEDGQIIRHSGHPGTTSGQVFGQSVYFRGRSGTVYFITHLGTIAPLGSYRKGQPVGTVSPWKSGSPHAHVGVHRGGR